MTLFRSLACLSVVLAACATAPVASAPPPAAPVQAAPPPPPEPAPPTLVTQAEGITEYQLANGLRVLLMPEPSKPTITVNMTYLVGSRFEGYGETGMAHLLEHMLFKGSTNHPNIPNELTSHGARPNGTTSYDRTNYFETFAATDENLGWALSLEADRMVHSFVAKKDLDTEMTVVRNEYERGENDPENILEERMLSTAFLWHNYGKATIGARSDIENVPIERLQAFWRKYYQPDNAILIVTGKFDPAKTLSLVQTDFVSIPKPDRVLIPTYTREPVQDGERSVTLRRAGEVQAVSVAYHTPAASHPDAAAIDVLAHVLGSTPSGRLYKALVEKKKAASVWAQAMLGDEPGVLEAMATVRDGDSLDDAEKTMLATFDGLAKNPITSAEVERARAELLKNIELTLANTEHVGLVLSEWIASGDWRLFFLHRDQLRKVSVADVQRAAADYLKPSNRTIGLFIPTPKPDRVAVPEAPAVDAQLAGYKGDPEAEKGEAFDPSPANIESRTTRTQTASGLKLALLTKKTRGATVNAAFIIRFGDEKSMSNLGQIPDATLTLLERGTSKHTREQLRDELDRLKTRINFGNAGPGTVTIAIETVRDSLPRVLALVAEMLKDSAFPKEEIDRLRQEWIAELEQQKTDPTAIANQAIDRHLAPYPKGDPRYVATFDEQVKEVNALKREDIVKFHMGFYGASNGELALVGDFDSDAVRKQLDDLFGSWKSAKPFKRIETKYFDVPAAADVIETPDKENAVFRAGLSLPLRDDDADYPSMVMGNFMLGGGFINSRLATRIRQKEGLSYGIGSWFFASAVDTAGFFGVQAISAPQNSTKVAKAFDEEMRRALDGGFEAAELDGAKSGWRQTRQLQRAQDAGLAMMLARYLFIDRTLVWDAALEGKVAALDAQTIQSALKRHLDPAKISQVRAGDFARLEKAK